MGFETVQKLSERRAVTLSHWHTVHRQLYWGRTLDSNAQRMVLLRMARRYRLTYALQGRQLRQAVTDYVARNPL